MEFNHLEKVRELFQSGYKETQLEEVFRQYSYSEEMIADARTEFQKLVNKKQQERGFALLIIGAIILVGSMLLSLIIPFSHPVFGYILYGVTSAGAVMVMAGLVMIIGF